jgi:cell division septal protein FtsQ
MGVVFCFVDDLPLAAIQFSYKTQRRGSGPLLPSSGIVLLIPSPQALLPVNPLLERPPSLLRRILRVLVWGLSGGALTTIAGLSIHHVTQDADFRVYEVRFEGNIHSTPSQLRHLADIRTDQHLLTVDLERTVAGVEQHPWVSSARARLSFPSTVTITVTEHHPRMLLALSDLWYISDEGQPFRRAQGNDLDYPVLTGIDPDFAVEQPELTSAIIGRALSLLDSTAVRPLHGPDSVSEIRFNTRTGFALVLRGGTEILLGFSDPEERLSRLMMMVDAGLDLSVPQRIDLVADRVATSGPLPEIPPFNSVLPSQTQTGFQSSP